MIRKPSYKLAVFALLAAPALHAQVPGADTIAALRAAHERVVRWGADAGPETWPGFRPDTIPHVYVLRGRGSVLFGWGGAPPEGWTPLADGGAWRAAGERGAASTGIEVEGRGAAQVVVESLDSLALAGVTAHESFHVHQRAARVRDRRFGAGENSMLLARYPVFDVANEMTVALEGLLLREALLAGDPAGAAEAARDLLAVRAIRQSRLPAEMREFEDAAELHEGLAEHALHRATSGDSLPAALWAGLAELTGDGGSSVRLRFYRTGSAMAHLLDRVGGPGWRQHALEHDLTLAGALAHAVGPLGDEPARVFAAGERHDLARLHERAAGTVAALRASRAARVDSVLAAPGLLLRVVPDRLGRHVDPCGFDPQNQLAVDERRLLHTRWLRTCTPGGFAAEWNAPVVEEDGSFTAVAGPEAEVRITIGGREVRLADGERIGGAADLRIDSPSVTVTAPRADVERAGRTIIIHPLP